MEYIGFLMFLIGGGATVENPVGCVIALAGLLILWASAKKYAE